MIWSFLHKSSVLWNLPILSQPQIHEPQVHHLPETLDLNYIHGYFASINRISTINSCLSREKKLYIYTHLYVYIYIHTSSFSWVLNYMLLFTYGYKIISLMEQAFLLPFPFWVVYFLFCTLNIFPVSHKIVSNHHTQLLTAMMCFQLWRVRACRPGT